jgi:aspartate/methionine/tyrosine aminotransferase
MQKALLAKYIQPIQYGIREIVQKGKQMEAVGFPVNWENIGDPVHKGMTMPQWMLEVIGRQVGRSESFAYCDSKGTESTRTFLADKTNRLGGVQIGPEDITFFNGLGDAITTLYRLLSPGVKVIQPSPAYPAHTSAERLRLGAEPLTYACDPQRGWRPDVQDLREKVRANPDVMAILVVNPDNPSGAVHAREDLEAIVEVAREFDLVLIADEIYEHVVFDGVMTRLAEVIGPDVCGIAMKGISKEFPWPGARCGWVEVYNRWCEASERVGFDAYCTRVDKTKMSEVCSTTLPQLVIPEIMQDERYPALLASRNEQYRQRMEVLQAGLSGLEGWTISRGGGGFYAVITMDSSGTLASSSLDALSMEADVSLLMSPERRALFKGWRTDAKTDAEMDAKTNAEKYAETDAEPSSERKGLLTDHLLTDYLLAGFGICAVPLSAFNSPHIGFRITLLEADEVVFEEMVSRLREALASYQPKKLGSTMRLSMLV